MTKRSQRPDAHPQGSDQMVLDALTNEKTGAIQSLKEVDAIGHRVVHGGEKFASSAVITEK